MPYTPKYVDIDDVPISSVPDDYSPEEKREALQFAEGKLEMDINDGNRIIANELVQPMKVAIKYLSTYQLTLGAEHVDNMALSDLDDDGSTKTEYANEYLRMYHELVSGISDSDAAPGDSESQMQEYVYSTSKPDDDWKDIPYDTDRVIDGN